MEINPECRISKELKKTLSDYHKRISAIEAWFEKNKNPLDLNGDGKVDKEDASIAGKVLSNQRKQKNK